MVLLESILRLSSNLFFSILCLSMNTQFATQFEARDRVGGRCATDKITFKRPDGTPFPIDLGAAWVREISG